MRSTIAIRLAYKHSKRCGWSATPQTFFKILERVAGLYQPNSEWQISLDDVLMAYEDSSRVLTIISEKDYKHTSLRQLAEQYSTGIEIKLCS